METLLARAEIANPALFIPVVLGGYTDPDGYRPEPEPYRPTPEQEAERLAWEVGRELGLEGADQPDLHDRGLSDVEWRARNAGWLAGHDERIDRDWAEREELEAWLDALGGPEPDWDSMYPEFDPHHAAERVEAFGTGLGSALRD